MSDKVKVTSIPNCDLQDLGYCQSTPHKAVYDAKTSAGPWAYMCEEAFSKLGVGLGTGFGQRLVLED